VLKHLATHMSEHEAPCAEFSLVRLDIRIVEMKSHRLARRGELWQLYQRHYGPNGDERILIAQGASRVFNPTLPEHVVARALARDRAAASAEYLAEFRSDIEGFVSLEAVQACIDVGCRERAPAPGVHHYVGFVDPSGGSADRGAGRDHPDANYPNRTKVRAGFSHRKLSHCPISLVAISCFHM
jgi:hypothetical protein